MRVAPIAVGIALVACGSREYTLPALDRVTRVDVTDNNSRVLHTVSDPSVIARLKDFAEKRRSGWKEGFPDTPVPQLEALFYNDDKLIGDMGVGPGFFETMYSEGVWVFRTASPAEEQRFLQLISMPDYDLRKR